MQHLLLPEALVSWLTSIIPDKLEVCSERGHEKVGHEDADGGGNHRLGGGLADALSALAAVHSLVAGDGGNDAGEDERLISPIQMSDDQCRTSRCSKENGIKTKQEYRHHIPGKG
ncbi:MAG: hypothetical protein Ct9H300mP32_2510 [Verrucomicrobiota bacterium]|nr:MAG: hypothetical protein Ct9H300mP32_2510 [Verrucomicrobiota bacterium]